MLLLATTGLKVVDIYRCMAERVIPLIGCYRKKHSRHLSPAEACLVVSGRAGFELVQKAVAAGTGSLVAVGAPTSLSVRLAAEHGLALWAFTRSDRVVRYAG